MCGAPTCQQQLAGPRHVEAQGDLADGIPAKDAEHRRPVQPGPRPGEAADRAGARHGDTQHADGAADRASRADVVLHGEAILSRGGTRKWFKVQTSVQCTTTPGHSGLAIGPHDAFEFEMMT